MVTFEMRLKGRLIDVVLVEEEEPRIHDALVGQIRAISRLSRRLGHHLAEDLRDPRLVARCGSPGRENDVGHLKG